MIRKTGTSVSGQGRRTAPPTGAPLADRWPGRRRAVHTRMGVGRLLISTQASAICALTWSSTSGPTESRRGRAVSQPTIAPCAASSNTVGRPSARWWRAGPPGPGRLECPRVSVTTSRRSLPGRYPSRNKIALEVDGPHHRYPDTLWDVGRDGYLHARGWLVFRVDDTHGSFKTDCCHNFLTAHLLGRPDIMNRLQGITTRDSQILRAAARDGCPHRLILGVWPWYEPNRIRQPQRCPEGAGTQGPPRRRPRAGDCGPRRRLIRRPGRGPAGPAGDRTAAAMYRPPAAPRRGVPSARHARRRRQRRATTASGATRIAAAASAGIGCASGGPRRRGNDGQRQRKQDDAPRRSARSPEPSHTSSPPRRAVR
jgi:hypothetical protein